MRRLDICRYPPSIPRSQSLTRSVISITRRRRDYARDISLRTFQSIGSVCVRFHVPVMYSAMIVIIILCLARLEVFFGYVAPQTVFTITVIIIVTFITLAHNGCGSAAKSISTRYRCSPTADL